MSFPIPDQKAESCLILLFKTNVVPCFEFNELFDSVTFFTMYRNLLIRGALHVIEGPSIVTPLIPRSASKVLQIFKFFPIWDYWCKCILNATFQEHFKEISLAHLKIVRFSIRNHRWKAQLLNQIFESGCL